MPPKKKTNPRPASPRPNRLRSPVAKDVPVATPTRSRRGAGRMIEGDGSAPEQARPRPAGAKAVVAGKRPGGAVGQATGKKRIAAFAPSDERSPGTGPRRRGSGPAGAAGRTTAKDGSTPAPIRQRPAQPALGGKRPSRPVAQSNTETPKIPARTVRGERKPASGQGRGGRGPAQAGDVKAERLHKVLAQAGMGSRRDMEEWISAGRVSVNGEPAQLGQLVAPGDRVKVNGRLVNLHFGTRLPRVLLFNKSEGQIVSRDDPEQRETVFDLLPRMRGGRWIAIGRLDINTSGLLLFTTSGELANRLMHPRYEILREYAVRVLGELGEDTRRLLVEGIMLDDGPARFLSLEDGGGTGANRWYHVTLSEGRNREVRRMFEAVGVTVSRLMRVRYGPLALPPGVHRGRFAELDEAEVKALMTAVGL